MSRFVLDASVAAKWFLPRASETLVDEAFELLSRYTNGEIYFLVPDLFWAEFANILWKSIRQERCTKLVFQVAFTSLKERKLTTIASSTLIELAFDIALSFDRTVYDSLYIALAVSANAQLVTADQRLANAVAAQLPVKWLGAL